MKIDPADALNGFPERPQTSGKAANANGGTPADDSHKVSRQLPWQSTPRRRRSKLRTNWSSMPKMWRAPGSHRWRKSSAGF